MKEIKILWLYSDLLDLYGDSGNIRILEYYLKKNGFAVKVDSAGIFDELCFEGYDFIYCGPGKFSNLVSANEHFRKYAEGFRQCLEKGTPVLFSGSSLVLLGKSIEDAKGNQYESAGIFDYKAVDLDQVMTLDVVTETDLTADKIYGFINRTVRIVDETPEDVYHGYRLHDLWATYLLGPLLVKNPQLLSVLFEKITGIALDMSDTLEQKAYLWTIGEFGKVE